MMFSNFNLELYKSLGEQFNYNLDILLQLSKDMTGLRNLFQQGLQGKWFFI